MHEQAYLRRLPGGGFVRIDVESRLTFTGRRYRGLVTVERRGDPARRLGHAAPVIARLDGATVDGVVDRLLPLTLSNIELARAILGSRARRPA